MTDTYGNCSSCKGTGEGYEQGIEYECAACDGTGKTYAYDKGFRDGLEAAAKVCQDEIDRITSQPVFVNHATLLPGQLKHRIMDLCVPVRFKCLECNGQGEVRDYGNAVVACPSCTVRKRDSHL